MEEFFPPGKDYSNIMKVPLYGFILFMWLYCELVNLSGQRDFYLPRCGMSLFRILTIKFWSLSPFLINVLPHMGMYVKCKFMFLG